MKNLLNKIFFITVTAIIVLFSSCQKHEENFHKLRFHLSFKEVPPTGFSNSIEVLCSPDYDDDPAEIYAKYTTEGYEWDYEFWQLKDGDEVQFIVRPQLYYWFVMEVYIDDVLISSREMVTSKDTYYSTQTLGQSGLNNEASTNFPVISFYYYE